MRPIVVSLGAVDVVVFGRAAEASDCCRSCDLFRALNDWLRRRRWRNCSLDAAVAMEATLNDTKRNETKPNGSYRSRAEDDCSESRSKAKTESARSKQVASAFNVSAHESLEYGRQVRQSAQRRLIAYELLLLFRAHSKIYDLLSIISSNSSSSSGGGADKSAAIARVLRMKHSLLALVCQNCKTTAPKV